MVLEFWVKPEEKAIRLSHFLKSKEISLALIKKLKFLPDGILVDDVKQNTDYILHPGQKVTLNVLDRPQDVQISTVVPQQMPLDIVYQDKACMVINKPNDMPVHPSMNHPHGTLANGFCGYWQAKGQQKICRVLNRLDRNTSGLVLIALDAYSAEKLKGKVDKTYTAILQGVLPFQTGIIEAPIARQSDSIITRCVDKTGQYAKTGFVVTKQNYAFTQADVQLFTGRTHQIRVHFSYLGYPLAGDDLYGGNLTHINRHALHCSSLNFVSPHTKKQIHLYCKIPQDMEKIF